MIIDSSNEFSVAQVITSDASSTNSIEIATNALAGPVQIDGKLVVTVTETFEGADGLTVQLVTADDAALSTNVTQVSRTPLIATSDLIKGKRLWVTGIPKRPYRKFLGVKYVVDNGPFTDGAISALIVDVVDSGITTYAAPSTIHPNA